MSGRGLSAAGLRRLHDVMAASVERGAVPGLAALVARHGETHVEVLGAKAFEDTGPLERDGIFRIASLSKPIAAVAAMILVEEGAVQLDDAVDDWLPELADRQVLRSIDSELDDTVAARRPINLHDLLTFRMGFGCIMAPPGTYPIQRAEAELALSSLGPPWPPSPHTPDQWIRRLGTLPLMHQPGEQWMYNTGSQVLGVLLERATGSPLETFLRERIFEPLGMRDTGFSVSSAQVGRLTTAYQPDAESGDLTVLDGVVDSYWSRPPNFPDAAGWLVSTLDDYWAFVRMILDKGRHGAGRIISEDSVDRMISDHLTPDQRRGAGVFLGDHGGWGLGMLVPAADGQAQGVPGGFGWDGGTGTTWRSDTEMGITGILFTQRAMTSPEAPREFVDFWRCVYGAIED